jgi:hypothetical protein
MSERVKAQRGALSEQTASTWRIVVLLIPASYAEP